MRNMPTIRMFLMGSYCAPLLVDSLLYYSIDNIFVWWACFSWVPTVLLLPYKYVVNRIIKERVNEKRSTVRTHEKNAHHTNMLSNYSLDNIFVWWACFSWVLTVLLFSLTRSFIILLTTYLYGGHVCHGFLLCSSSRWLAPLLFYWQHICHSRNPWETCPPCKYVVNRIIKERVNEKRSTVRTHEKHVHHTNMLSIE
jgi:hypothetical protein